VGKTSTKDIVYEVVKQKYKTLKTQGNLNNHIGLPLTILRLKDEEALVVEMGMNHLKEISTLTNIAKPTIAIITNVGTAHIGNLGSRENILKAKLEITEGLSKEGTIIINNDNDLLHQYLPNLEKKYYTITVGITNKSNIEAKNIEEEPYSSKFTIDNTQIEINVGGIPFIYNSLIAYAIGKELDIEPNKIKESISNFKLSPHRLEKIINKKGVTIIDDTYNANVDSMLSAINILGKVKNKRKIALLADMLELGEYSEDLHRKVGESVAKNNIDILITVGPLSSKYIKEEAIKNNFNKQNIYTFNTYDETYKLLEELLNSNDIILLKGSNSMQISKIVDKIK
jgi:UDP-N-acetylmuramoyl-tripeptide--D-alanyl-D-alanine ligase